MSHAIRIGPFEEGVAPSYVDFVCTEPEGARCRVWCDRGCVTELDHDEDQCELYDQGYCGWIEGWFDDAYAWRDRFDGDGEPVRDGEIDFHHHGEDGPTWFYLPPRTRPA